MPRTAFPRRDACVRIVAALVAVLLVGCATDPAATVESPDRSRASPGLMPWRTVIGGFLAPPGAAFGLPARTGTGAFVKFIAPTAVALRDNDLLVVDSGAGRVWRVDLALNTLSQIAGAPATPVTTVALGPDLSAWVHDQGARQILRFARDGRLLQTYSAGYAASSPVGFTLADGGATLLVADAGLRAWVEFRPVGSFATSVRPGSPDGQRVAGVDGLASGRDTVYVLDRGSAVVHIVDRGGLVRGALGQGELKQPVAIAADGAGRVFVLDAQDRSVKLLRPGLAALVFDAAQLRVQVIGAIAVHGRLLAVSDRLTGQVVIHVVHVPERP